MGEAALPPCWLFDLRWPSLGVYRLYGRVGGVPPRGLMPGGPFQECCCQCTCPHGEPLQTHTSKGDPPTLAGGDACTSFYSAILNEKNLLASSTRGQTEEARWTIILLQLEPKPHHRKLTGWKSRGFCTRWRDKVVLLFSHSVVSNSLLPHGLQHARLSCPSPVPGASSNSCPLSWWCHPTISSSVIPFSSCLPSFTASGTFPMSQQFTSGGTGASVSASVLPKNIQGLFPPGLPDLVSLQSKGLSRVFSNTTVQKHQLFSSQLSLWSNCHIHTWLLEKP